MPGGAFYSLMSKPPDIVLGSFIADALALGPHWVYDRGQIVSQLGRVTRYHPPLAKYHPGKRAGDLTHYGDQALLLLRSIADGGGFELARFAAVWRGYWEDPATLSYRDGATKATLANLQAGVAPASAASASSDMGGATRIAPLFLLRWENDAALLDAARAVTAFTHGAAAVIQSAGFFARVALAAQRGVEIPAALEEAAAAGGWDALPDVWLAAARESSGSAATDAAALEKHGLSCDVADAFPGICHLLLRYPQDPATALIENASAGGDSAARGMILGLVYGARFPVSTWPPEWRDALQAGPEINRLIQGLAPHS